MSRDFYCSPCGRYEPCESCLRGGDSLAGVVEMADTPDSKSGALGREGSTPSPSTYFGPRETPRDCLAVALMLFMSEAVNNRKLDRDHPLLERGREALERHWDSPSDPETAA